MLASFVIPTFNCVAWLPQAIESAQNQTVKDCEIIVVDDCSTDSTPQFLEWLQKNTNVNVLRNTANSGRSYSRNRGNAEAKGDVIFVLDADDYASPNRVELTLKKFRNEVQFVYGSANTMTALGQQLNTTNADVINKKDLLETEPYHSGIVHSTVAYTKQFAKDYPYSDGEIAKLGIDDWDQQVRAVVHGVKMDFVQHPISAYRILQTAISNNRDPKQVLEAKKKVLTGLKVHV